MIAPANATKRDENSQPPNPPPKPPQWLCTEKPLPRAITPQIVQNSNPDVSTMTTKGKSQLAGEILAGSDEDSDDEAAEALEDVDDDTEDTLDELIADDDAAKEDAAEDFDFIPRLDKDCDTGLSAAKHIPVALIAMVTIHSNLAIDCANL